MYKGATVQVENVTMGYLSKGRVTELGKCTIGVDVPSPLAALTRKTTVHFKRDESGTWVSLAGHFRLVEPPK